MKKDICCLLTVRDILRLIDDRDKRLKLEEEHITKLLETICDISKKEELLLRQSNLLSARLELAELALDITMMITEKTT